MLSLLMDLPPLVAGLARCHWILCLEAALGGPPRLLNRLRPGAVQLHDLGAMHQAAAGEGDQVGLALAPAGKSDSPLLGAAKLVGVLAGQDHAAVDDPGGDRGELASGDRDHRLVQQRQALLEAPKSDQDVALLLCGEGEQIRVLEALADRRRLGCGYGGGFQVAASFLLEDERQQQIAALDSVTALAVEQPLGAAKPTAGPAQLPSRRRA